ncbi:MAG: TIGR03067 domain-containing protein [Planctomycetes bacterium]|nr:TIGR03067 domain-containing protein [Planctomycetota bacterium]
MIEQLLVLAAGLLAPVPKDDATKDKIEGTWVVVSATRNGKTNDEIKDDKVTFKDGKLTIKAKNKDETATYKVDPAKKPKEIDITHEGGKTMQGIYVVEGDTLKVCFSKPDSPRPTEFSAKEGSDCMLVVLKREKK